VNAELFDTMVLMMFAGSCAILGVLALRNFARRWFGAQIAYVAWAAVPFVALATLLPAPVRPVSTMLMLHAAHPMSAHASMLAATPASIDWRPVIALIWLAGVVVAGCVFGLQQRRYLRSLGRLHALDEGLLRADSVDVGPALVGAWRPRIVLPADFDLRYAPCERELILAHEHTHRARGDALINALVTALRCLNWFNPLVHYAAVKFRFDQELACDAAVITRFPEARRSYADAMLKTQLAGQSRQELRLPVGCRWPSGHPLKERILMLKHPLPTRARRVLGMSVVAGVAACGSFVSWAGQPARTELASMPANHPASENVSFRKMMPPTYPASAVKEHVSGNVQVKIHVSESGEPESAIIASVEPPEAVALSDAAIATVMKWHFNPEIRDGVAVAGDIVVPIDFAFDDEDGPNTAANQSIAASYRSMSAPTYPASAVRNHIEGIVYVAVEIDATGHVGSATVDHVEPAIAMTLGSAATNAVGTWQFNAPVRNGKATSGHAIVPLRFAINDPATINPSTLPPQALEIIDVVAQPASRADG
jgi:TonB family protein